MEYINHDYVCGFVITKSVYRKEFPDNPGVFCDMRGGLKINIYATSLPHVDIYLPVTAVKRQVYTNVSGVRVRDKMAEKIIERGFPYNITTPVKLPLLELLVKPEQKFFDTFLYQDFIPTAISVVDDLVSQLRSFDTSDHVHFRQYAQHLDTYSRVKYQLYHGVGCVRRGEKTIWDKTTPENSLHTDDDIMLEDD